MVIAAACVCDLLASMCEYLNAYILSNYFPIFLDAPEVKWSEVKWIEVKWSKLNWIELNWSEVKWTEVSYWEVLGDKIAMYIRVTLYWGYLIILWLFIWVYLVLWLF